VRLRDVRVTREDGTVALEQVSLDVAAGEVLAIVGPSGSGKTTLLRAVAGLVDVRGTVELGGRDVTAVSTDRRDLAMVFEAGTLISFLDVQENLGFGLRLHHVEEGERNERVDAEARRLRLGRLLSRKPASLSAGERGRANIGRALVRRPSAWLFDEPLAHLDPGERFELRHRLVQEVKRQEVATLYVTHDPVEALAVGDRVAVLHQARLVQVDSPRALYARPANVFVATFVASQPLGLVTGRLVRTAGLAGVQLGERTVPFWAGLPPELEGYQDRDVALAWRPEDVQDAAEVDDPNVARLRGVVVASEFTGPSVLAVLELDAPPATGAGIEEWMPASDRARLVVRLPRDHPVQLGMSLTLAVDAARAHVFDPATGVALRHPADLEQLPSGDVGDPRER
jgi:multiple sugar transport system ATP-binding protein